MRDDANPPQRLQLSRRKGFRLQEHSRLLNGRAVVKVDRTSKRWGNHVGRGLPHQAAVAAFKDELRSRPELVQSIRRELRGKNLACWCKPGDPCHADVLLAVANA